LTRDGPDISISSWSAGADQAIVELVLIGDAEHPWPGGTTRIPRLSGEPSDALDASETLWAFLSQSAR
jgi:poly(3-hydroxybutyrate) depolymerase